MQQQDNQIEEIALKWWNSVEKISLSDLGGMYWKTLLVSRKEAADIIGPLDSRSLESLNRTHKYVGLKIGRKACPQAYCDSLSEKSPIVVVDRHKSAIGRLLSKISFGKYRRYSWCHTAQVQLVALTQHQARNTELPLTVYAIVTSSSEMTTKMIRESALSFSQYQQNGFMQ